jgi:hypothetical protein
MCVWGEGEGSRYSYRMAAVYDLDARAEIKKAHVTLGEDC